MYYPGQGYIQVLNNWGRFIYEMALHSFGYSLFIYVTLTTGLVPFVQKMDSIILDRAISSFWTTEAGL